MAAAQVNTKKELESKTTRSLLVRCFGIHTNIEGKKIFFSSLKQHIEEAISLLCAVS